MTMYSVIPWLGAGMVWLWQVCSWCVPLIIENKPKSLPLFCLLTFFIIGPAFVFFVGAVVVIIVYYGAGAA